MPSQEPIPHQGEFTRLLAEIGSGSDRWNDALPLIYTELRRIASLALSRSPGPSAIEPTELAHEVWERLREREGWRDREHFLAVSAIAIRGILVDRLREAKAQKRGGGAERVTLHSRIGEVEAAGLDLLDVHEALKDLAELDDRQARVVELRVFGGLTVPEVARVLQVAPSTIDMAWRTARAWLRGRLKGTLP